MSDGAGEVSGGVESGFAGCAGDALLLDAEAAAVVSVACATAGVAQKHVAMENAATEEAAAEVVPVASCSDVVDVLPPVS